MSIDSLTAASNVYLQGLDTEINRHFVKSDELERYSYLLRDLYGSLGENRLDLEWKTITRLLYRYREEHSVAPLPLGNPGSIGLNGINDIRNAQGSIKAFYPSISEKFSELVSSLDDCLSSDLNPLLTSLYEIVDTTKILLVKNRKLAEITELYLSTLDHDTCHENNIANPNLFTPEDLRTDFMHDQICVIGSAGLFPPHVFISPRAKKIDIFSFEWIKDDWKPAQSLEGYFHTSTSWSLNPHSGLTPNESHWTESQGENSRRTREDSINLKEVSLIFDWEQITDPYRGVTDTDEESDISIPVRLLHLESGDAIYLAKEANRKVLDMDSEEGKELIDAPVEDIEPGMFLLHRTGQGGDVIRDIANQILGNKKSLHLRIIQDKWKRRLQSKVDIRGISKVIEDLQDSGVTIANAVNLRNWLSRESLRTRMFEHFKKILEYSGIGEESRTIWEGMETLAVAHRQAGHLIRFELLKAVAEIDRNEFLHEGRIDFALPDMKDQRLTASRIQYIHEVSKEIPSGRTDIFFTPEAT